MTCTDEKAPVGEPNRIAYRIRHDMRYLYLPTPSPPRLFVEVGHTLLTEQLNMMWEANGEDGLTVWRGGPVEVRNRFR